MRARRRDDRIRGMQRVRQLLRLRQDRMAKSGLRREFRSHPSRRLKIAVAAPGQTGISARPASARTARVLRVAAASETLPTTVETPRICVLVVRAGVEQRERIVDASIDVKEE